MYNGIEAVAVKGTGLSGYVQRSRATVGGQGRAAVPSLLQSDDSDCGRGVNPLEQRRSHRENEDLAARLEAHRLLREIKLRVLLYGEERRVAGVEDATVRRECDELYTSLVEEMKRGERGRQRAEAKKTAAQFAAAFDVKAGSSRGTGWSFDRAVQATEKEKNEEARRKGQEQGLVEHLKRVRREEEEKS